jgi:hypothetical protein
VRDRPLRTRYRQATTGGGCILRIATHCWPERCRWSERGRWPERGRTFSYGKWKIEDFLGQSEAAQKKRPQVGRFFDRSERTHGRHFASKIPPQVGGFLSCRLRWVGGGKARSGGTGWTHKKTKKSHAIPRNPRKLLTHTNTQKSHATLKISREKQMGSPPLYDGGGRVFSACVVLCVTKGSPR